MAIVQPVARTLIRGAAQQLIDGIVEHRVAERHPSSDKGEVFELFCLEEILKDRDLSADEIDAGWIDGQNDGGIDGFYVLVNGHSLRDGEPFPWPKRSAEIEVWLISCKHHDTFQQAPLNSILASVSELLDLSIGSSELKGSYSADLLRMRGLLDLAYRKLSHLSATLAFRIVYASRGDASAVAENVATRADQIVQTVGALFSGATTSFTFVGATELVSLVRRVKSFSLELQVVDQLSTDGSSHLALATLAQYSSFVTDEDGQLRRYLFDSNVRDYMGPNRINGDISNSLHSVASPDFWWLNNGVTILATRAQPVGKALHIQDVQIVNGLQTTESIYRYVSSGGSDRLDRCVLVKVVTSTDAGTRDEIIKATNNQNVVELASLRATDKIQRDIEEILEKHEWFYERRKNYFKNLGKPLNRFVTPLFLAAGFIGLVAKNPAHAAAIRSKSMQDDEKYRIMFPPDLPLAVWVSIVEILKRIEGALEANRPSRHGEKFLSNWRNLIGLLIVAKNHGGFDFGHGYIGTFDARLITVEAVSELVALVNEVKVAPEKKNFRSYGFVSDCCNLAAKRFGLRAPQAVGRTRLFNNHPPPPAAVTDPQLAAVDAALPPQPWKSGVHRLVANKTGLPTGLVSAAISELMRRGVRQRQKDGIVYDASGTVVGKDPDRHTDESSTIRTEGE
jgi:hypothetical protein